MEVSASAIGTGAPFSVNAVRKVVRTEPPKSSGSRSSTGALLFTASTWMKRLCRVAVAGAVIDDDVDDARDGRRVGAGVVERDLLQCRLISGQRRGAREREDAGSGIVGGSRDAGRQCSVKDQNIVGCRVRQRDRRRGEAPCRRR